METYRIKESIEFKITETVSIILIEDERLPGIEDEKEVMLFIHLNNSDFAGMKIHGKSAISLKVSKEKVENLGEK